MLSRILLRVTAALFLIGLFFAFEPPAAKAGSDFTWYVTEAVVKGKETPTFTLIPPLDLTQVVLQVEDDKGNEIAQKTGPIKAGEKAEISWSQPVGRRSYKGRLRFWIDQSEYELQVSFAIAVGQPPTINVKLDSIDPKKQTLIATSSQQAGSAEVSVIGEGGAELYATTLALNSEKAGDPILIEWGPVGGTPLRIDLKITDPNGFPGAYTVYPWSYEVPHEEVVFASGQAAIRPEEAPKLDGTWKEIQKILSRYGDIVEMNLYVAGYTDTVDDAASNLHLSDARAKAIAAHFKSLGFDRPIYYQGFGEKGLAVPTDDGVDMEANRRAVYVLSANAPASGDRFPGARWKKLQ